MTNSLIRRPVVCAGIVALAISLIGQTAMAQKPPKPKLVDCNEGASIQVALDKAKDGTVVEVKGFCVENITILKNQITLRAVDEATLAGPDISRSTIEVQALNVRIENFSSISGGRDVIRVHRSGSADIEANTIEGGDRHGIQIVHGSYAHIELNTIQHNKAVGVNVRQTASADIRSNTISENDKQAIQVSAAAAADIDDNTITGNLGNGIRVRRTAHIRLSESSSFGQANTIEGNGGYGTQCRTNSSVRSGTGQSFGAGNGLGNLLIQFSCVVSGVI
jgi:hypothetical protein